MSHRKDGRLGIAVNGDDFGGLFHSGPMLNSPANAGGDIEGTASKGGRIAEEQTAVKNSRLGAQVERAAFAGAIELKGAVLFGVGAAIGDGSADEDGATLCG